MLDYDLYIAGGLVVIALVVFFLTQIGLLPKKSIPIVAGALLGGLGLVIFRAARQRALEAQLKQVKKEVDDRDKRLTQMQQQYGLKEQEVAAQRARLEDQITARQKEVLALQAQDAARKQQVDQMTPAQVREAAGQLGIGGE